MAARKHLPEATILSAKHQIFNNLCTAYVRSKENRLVSADELRQEFAIPEAIFAEVIFVFTDVEKQMAVAVVEDKGRTHFKLGEAGRDLCADWSAKEKRSPLRKAEPPLNFPVDSLATRSV